MAQVGQALLFARRTLYNERSPFTSPWRLVMSVRSVVVAAACSCAAIALAASGAQTTPVGQTAGRGQGGRGGGGPITIRAARVLDGRGGSLQNSVIEVQGSKITAIDQRTGGVTYDLGDVTVLPGMMDVHVHLNWYFGPSGKYGERDVPAGYVMDAIIENARKTLMAGFTTVQSVGAAQDK